ncbi:hypothetical protein EG328_005915 [Venturia inaequalis]|uniref:RRM domain-containing protein n=1 Tax=Venturia inaequalis TaxID=5025 RepID=A0A8H3YVX2_VENIN|nr:hypothetical protein EG328_005915 [Venturia inaequalis]KAE9971950.1 hypothetical protein EG327_009669 [Venturia inaequalis]
MAVESTKTKRKSLDRKVKTSEDAPPAKKAKTTATEAPSPKPEKVKAAAEAKKNRKRAADFIDTAEVEVEKAEPAPKKTKKQKVVAPVEDAPEEPIAAPKAKKVKVDKRAKKTTEVVDTPEPVVKAKKGKKTEEVVDAPEPVEDKPVKAKKGKKAEEVVDAPEPVVKAKKGKKIEEVVDAPELVEDKPVKAKKGKKAEEIVDAPEPVVKAKKGKKTEEIVDSPEPVEEKPVKAKKGKKTEKIDEAPAELAEPVEDNSKKAKKEKAKGKNKKAEEVIEPAEAVEEKPVKEKKAKAEKKGKKAAAEVVEVAKVTEVTEETTAGASKPKKSKVEKKGKKAAEPVAEIVEETTTIETVKPKKAKAAKKDVAPVEVIEETTVVETVKPKKAKAEKATKKIVEVVTEEPEVAPKSILKKGKKVAKLAEEAETVPTSILKTKADKMNGESKELITADSLEDAFDGFSSGEEDNIADQTAALLAGFDSTDESEAGDDEGLPLDMVPKVKLDKAAKKALAAAKKEAEDVPGTLYVGRVPHGFYEHQMKAYFTQFGDVNRLRVSRNKKTGASRHFAFVEFSSREVADIVATTMNNYLMFGHIMKIRLMTPEQVHPDLWKGAGKRFKVIPRAKLAARDLAQPKGRDYWRKKIESEEKVRAEKMDRLKEVGYVFEMPAVRKVEDVAMKGTDEAVSGEVQAVAVAEEIVIDEPVLAIEPASAVVVDAVEKEVMSVLSKKKGKGKGSEIIGDAVRVTKKNKKSKGKA